jgi:hypothetical protein
MKRRIVAGLLIAGLSSGECAAQSATPPSDTQLSKDVENPITRTITVPLEYEADFFTGPYKLTNNTFELDQAVVPFRLNNDWSLITRTKLPFVAQPPQTVGGRWADGLTNGYTTFFLSPEHGRGFYWGVGPVLYFPTATSMAVGNNKWGSGPSVAFVLQDQSPWVFALVANNIWSFGGPAPVADRTNQLLLNPTISYHFADGWSVSSSPSIAANWIAAGGKWTVPVGGGFGKVVRLGGQPVQLAVDAYYNAIRPQAANDTWLIQLTMTFIFAEPPR